VWLKDFSVSLSLICFNYLLSFLDSWHQLAAHSQSSQSLPCHWVAETLALRRSVFLASSAVFRQRDPGEFCLIGHFLRGVMLTLGDLLLIHKWMPLHGGRWGCLFLLSSEFNSTLSDYHNTKLSSKGNYFDACYPSTVADRGPWCLCDRVTLSQLWWMVIGGT